MQSLEQKLKKAEENNEKLLSYRPLPKETLKSLKDYYRVGLTYSSNALEGNSLTESETKIVIEDGLTIDGKPLRDIYEAVGHAKAYDYIWELASRKILEEEDILLLHRFFYEMIDSKNAGTYRQVPVFISGSEYSVTPFKEIEKEMKAFVKWFNQTEHKMNPVEFAAHVHKKFVFIHPFIDGNGRLARLLMNLSLLRNKYSIALIPAILRSEYIRTLETAHINDVPFKEFIADRVIETQNDLLRLFKTQMKQETKADNVNSKTKPKNENVGGVDSSRHGGVNADHLKNGGVDNSRHGDINTDNPKSGGVDSSRHGGVNTDNPKSGGVDNSRHGGVNTEIDETNDTHCQLVLECIYDSPGINTPGIVEKLNISLRTTQRCLKKLVDGNQIEFRGAPKTGGYYLTEI
ncbi:hypothetical protein MmiHf6_00510 [Methanimicrococcus hongohii]|uniref:Fido domain-containing protein n=1 Tax=Methanimicrococcus hongohii TaxID=3028295 RepID=A0AA96UY54_9EURY|nr:Fic family protein [Methanimicrococcus sp. Hf6]WNY22766.1 hypothetical protein MmiHf6_00510 [Methanimicrococcus sp. Hf6]